MITTQHNPVKLDNGQIKVLIDSSNGTYDVVWHETGAIIGAFGEVKLADGTMLKSTNANKRTVEFKKVKDSFGAGNEVIVHNYFDRKPEMRQLFWVYKNRPEAIVRVEIVGSSGSNCLIPLITESKIELKHEAPLNCLFVPWDNDMYFRFRSDGWGEGQGDEDGSYEVGALYEDKTRNGIVVGSLDHDLWKSAIRFKRNGGVSATAGVTSKYTHDTEPHGTVTGNVVSSPRMMIGLYDWRKGLERFGDLNAIVKPRLAWKGSVPFAWNSWSPYKAQLSAEKMRVATDFIHDDLPSFRSGGTAYINFDSFWSNLTPAQLTEFIKHAHSLGLKTGIYWTPFACWGGLDNKIDPGSAYKYSDICLKDSKGNLMPKLDGAYPIDPTHPGTIDHIDKEMKTFVDYGFDYVKLDFLSHGAIEGKHFDPHFETGTAAYAYGMKRIADDLSPQKIGRPFFVSLSIAPLFPYGFAHSRRISCDVFANIGASEYLLNSTNYGWWPAGRLYQYYDPDSACVYQPMDEPPVTVAESQTRFTASVISGSMIISGDDFLKPEAVARVKQFFKNDEVLALARKTPQFWPVDGATKAGAGDSFVWHDGADTYIAVFNFSKTVSKPMALPLSRLGLSDGSYSIHELWSREDRASNGEITFQLQPMSCSLVRLRKK